MKVKIDKNSKTMYVDMEGEEHQWDPEEFKYLKVKTKVIVKKLEEKYPDIVTMILEKDPGNIKIGFKQWGPDHRLILLLGNKGQSSFWMNNLNFKTNLSCNGQIEAGNFNDEFEQLCKVIDQAIIDFAS